MTRRTAHAAFVALAALALTACGTQVSTGARAADADSGVGASGEVAAGAHGVTGQVTVGPAAPEGVYGLGDSVMLGSLPLLTRAGVTVDAAVGRQFGSGVSLVRRRVVAGTLPRNVVVHLGTNGTIAAKDCRAIVDTAGPGRRVFLVNVLVPRSWTVGNNRVLRACDTAYTPDRVRIIDWAAAAAAHPSWIGADRIHPLPGGRAAYTALITGTVARFGL